jgi:tetratricopeptide (TPR) repeat protein
LVFAAFDVGIAASGGVLVKTMGDGCLASFGSAADAVTSAVAIQQTVADLRELRVPGLALRVGVAVGDVTEEDGDVFGPAVVTASRLCSAAGEHQILATEMVRMLAGDRGGHRYDAVGDLILKGIAAPVAACRVRFEPTGARAPIPAALAATPNEIVVGRDEELRVLVSALKEATAGERRAVLVAGEPGIGKTRLVAAIARMAHDEGALVVFGRCEEDLAVAYQPFAEGLRTVVPALDDATVQAHIEVHGGELRRLVPAIDAPEPTRGEPITEQARLFEAVTDLIHRAAAERPIVLVLDDLHWAAPATIALLRHLLAADACQRLCVLGTYRDTEVDRTHALGGLLADIHRIDGAERLALRGLDGQGVVDLLEAASGDELDADGRALAAAVEARTAGNPFFAGQVLRHLVERGVLAQEEGRWKVHGALADVDLPEGVLDVLGRRLSRLSEGANQALSVAALCGLEFGARVLCAVSDAGAPDAVVDGLDEAVHARLLVETGPGRYAFAHAIVRDALDRELTTAKRARLHRAIGEGILSVYGDAPTLPLAELARHFTEAAVLGDTASAARWAISAADAAVDQADLRGAIDVLERALVTIEAVEPVDQPSRFDVAAAITERHYAVLEVSASAVASAADAARQLGSGECLLRVALSRWLRGPGVPDPDGVALIEEALPMLDPSAVPLRALAHATLGGLRAMQADPAFLDDVEAALDLLPELSDAPKVACTARFWIVFAIAGTPGAAERLRLCDDGLRSWSEPDAWWDRLGLKLDFSSFLLIFRGHALLGLGRRDDYEANHARYLAMGERTGVMFMVAQAHVGVALLALLDGRLDEVGPSANEMIQAAPDDENFRLSYLALMARVALEQGRAAEIVPLLEASRAITPDHVAMQANAAYFRLASGDPEAAVEPLQVLFDGWEHWARDWVWPMAITLAAEVVAGLEHRGYAERLLAEIEGYAGEMALVGAAIFCLGAYDQFRGMLLSVLDRHDEAVATLEAAGALDARMRAPALSARTSYWLARALLRRNGPGDRERALGELAGCVATAQPLGLIAIADAAIELTERTSA